MTNFYHFKIEGFLQTEEDLSPSRVSNRITTYASTGRIRNDDVFGFDNSKLEILSTEVIESEKPEEF